MCELAWYKIELRKRLEVFLRGEKVCFSPFKKCSELRFIFKLGDFDDGGEAGATAMRILVFIPKTPTAHSRLPHSVVFQVK